MIKKTMSLLLCFIMICMPFAANAENGTQNVQNKIYVSLEGSDENTGTIDAPFKTIARAQAEVRKLNKDMTGDIHVYLREGVYHLDKTLVFEKEDGGTNGYNIKYTAYNGENVKISGGRKIEGWKKTEGKLWEADLSHMDIEYAMQLSVNDRRAMRAKSEERVLLDELLKLEGSQYAADGLVVYDSNFSEYENQEDIQLHFARGWKSYLLNVDKIVKTGDNSTFYMEQPFFDEVTSGRESFTVVAGNNFWLENAFEELDEEGEFYYNRQTKKLYYMPRADEDMKSAEVELAVLEELITIKGKDSAEKVKNIIFDSLTLAHATYLRMSRYGIITDQAQTMEVHESDKPGPLGFYQVAANIVIDRAEKIQFTNNVIRDMGAVAIALVEGVYNCKFEGNVFCDIGDSAMTIGLINSVYQDKLYEGRDLAHGKLTTSSQGAGTSTYYSSYAAVDGSKKTGWSPGGSGPFWWQVDLGEPYEIDRVEVDDREEVDNSIARQNFEILGSNDPTFSTYTVLGVQGSTPYPHKGTGIYYIENDEKFRYVRIAKSDVSYLFLTEVRVINESMEYAPACDLNHYNLIKNNYITRIGVINYSAPGIQAYYSQGTQMIHNTIYDVPYSGLCSGWGWNQYPDLVDARDNRINYNKIEKSMQVCIDGGGIYTLGKQQNSQMIGNYITGQINQYGGIYGDNTTSFFTYRENVTEDVCIAYLGSGNGEGILWENNYSTQVKDMISSSKGLRIHNNQVFMPGDPPLEALETMMNAGLEPRYEHIKEKAGENYWYTDDILDITNNSRHEMDKSIMNPSNFIHYFISNHIQSARRWLDMAKEGKNPGEYPKEALDKFAEAIETAAAVARKEPVDMVEVLKARQALVVDAVAELNASRVVYSDDEIVGVAEKELSETKVGNGLGQITKENYDHLKNALEIYKNEPQDKLKKQYLDKALIRFHEKKISLDITGFKIAGQMGAEKIDEETGIITINAKHATNLSSIVPMVDCNDQIKVTPSLDLPQNFKENVTYTLSSPDGTSKKSYTVKVVKPTAFNSDEELDLKSAIENKDQWALFGAYNVNSYQGELYGDVNFAFNMEIEQRTAYDWPSFVFRAQDPEKSFDDTANDAYILVFNPGAIELHRFNKGVRTQFYGPVKNVTTIFGDSIKTDIFKFNQKNEMRLTTKNENGGVRIKLTINGEEVINFVDNYKGAITSPGYIATISPSAPVVLTGK